MPLFKNIHTGDVVTAQEATVGFLKQQGVWVPVDDTDETGDPVEVDELKGARLEEALKANDLPLSGTADEKRARLAEHLAGEDNTAGTEDVDPDDDPDPSQDQ